jgi:hypothetical protein
MRCSTLVALPLFSWEIIYFLGFKKFACHGPGNTKWMGWWDRQSILRYVIQLYPIDIWQQAMQLPKALRPILQLGSRVDSPILRMAVFLGGSPLRWPLVDLASAYLRFAVADADGTGPPRLGGTIQHGLTGLGVSPCFTTLRSDQRHFNWC